jgi:hypothetical protein
LTSSIFSVKILFALLLPLNQLHIGFVNGVDLVPFASGSTLLAERQSD